MILFRFHLLINPVIDSEIKTVRRAMIFLLSLSAICLFTATLSAQNVVRDYVHNVPRQYGPHDPWTVGVVMRHQTGHSGLFYNCDCEEHKRLSPYIRWERQPTVCCRHCHAWFHCWDIHQQIDEVQQRIRTGSCKQCEYWLCPDCTTSQPRPLVDCPQSGCQSCATDEVLEQSAPVEPTLEEATPMPAEPANSTSWLRTLYSR